MTPRCVTHCGVVLPAVCHHAELDGQLYDTTQSQKTVCRMSQHGVKKNSKLSTECHSSESDLAQNFTVQSLALHCMTWHGVRLCSVTYSKELKKSFLLNISQKLFPHMLLVKFLLQNLWVTLCFTVCHSMESYIVLCQTLHWVRLHTVSYSVKSENEIFW